MSERIAAAPNVALKRIFQFGKCPSFRCLSQVTYEGKVEAKNIDETWALSGYATCRQGLKWTSKMKRALGAGHQFGKAERTRKQGAKRSATNFELLQNGLIVVDVDEDEKTKDVVISRPVLCNSYKESKRIKNGSNSHLRCVEMFFFFFHSARETTP
ncbi:hypothetical protein B0H12DRAFT_1226429 [Mycena haematopus]|nr:hypothetical protein B0H12DRAFT_1226429 [Mycena haematopus]